MPELHVYDFAREMGRAAWHMAQRAGLRRSLKTTPRWPASAGQRADALGYVRESLLSRKFLADVSRKAPYGATLSRVARLGPRPTRFPVREARNVGIVDTVSELQYYPSKRGMGVRAKVILGHPRSSRVLSHELGHVAAESARTKKGLRLWDELGPEFDRSRPLRMLATEIAANRYGAELYKRAGGDPRRYWRLQLRALGTYAGNPELIAARIRPPKRPLRFHTHGAQVRKYSTALVRQALAQSGGSLRKAITQLKSAGHDPRRWVTQWHNTRMVLPETEAQILREGLKPGMEGRVWLGPRRTAVFHSWGGLPHPAYIPASQASKETLLWKVRMPKRQLEYPPVGSRFFHAARGGILQRGLAFRVRPFEAVRTVGRLESRQGGPTGHTRFLAAKRTGDPYWAETASQQPIPAEWLRRVYAPQGALNQSARSEVARNIVRASGLWQDRHTPGYRAQIRGTLQNFRKQGWR